MKNVRQLTGPCVMRLLNDTDFLLLCLCLFVKCTVSLWCSSTWTSEAREWVHHLRTLRDVVPKTVENFEPCARGRREWATLIAFSIALFLTSCCRAISPTGMEPEACPSTATSFLMRINLKHDKVGINAGPGTNGSILYHHRHLPVAGRQACGLWRGKDGFDLVKKIEAQAPLRTPQL